MTNYKNISWIPVDIPLIDFKDELINEFSSFYPTYAREAQRLTVHRDNYGKTTWLNNLSSTQAKLKEYIDINLPFTDLVNVKIQRLFTNDVFHYDFMSPDNNKELYQHNTLVEPCGYRFVLSGTRHGDLVIVENDVHHYPELPIETDCYVLGHTNSLHSCVNFKPDRYIVFCHGWVDIEKHYSILDRSLKKYQDFAVYKV